jgi:hypothetical protein
MRTGYDENEIENGVIVEEVDAPALALLNKSEIDMQIATAKKYPRSITTFIKESTALVTLSEIVADECIYALPRKEFDKETKKWVTKNIEGPSARFAEVIGTTWGNNRAGARVVGEEREFINAQGFFYDLERNVGRAFEVRRRITDSNGDRYRTDMIGVTGNAAVSIAFRNAVLKSVPKAFWGQIYEAARKVVIGDLQTLDNRRLEAMSYLQKFGMTEAIVLEILGVKGIPDISGDHLLQLRGMVTALKNHETTLEDILAGLRAANGSTALPNELKRKSEQNGHQQRV